MYTDICELEAQATTAWQLAEPTAPKSEQTAQARHFLAPKTRPEHSAQAFSGWCARGPLRAKTRVSLSASGQQFKFRLHVFDEGPGCAHQFRLLTRDFAKSQAQHVQLIFNIKI